MRRRGLEVVNKAIVSFVVGRGWFGRMGQAQRHGAVLFVGAVFFTPFAVALPLVAWGNGWAAAVGLAVAAAGFAHIMFLLYLASTTDTLAHRFSNAAGTPVLQGREG